MILKTNAKRGILLAACQSGVWCKSRNSVEKEIIFSWRRKRKGWLAKSWIKFYYIEFTGIPSSCKSIKTLARQCWYDFYPYMCDHFWPIRSQYFACCKHLWLLVIKINMLISFIPYFPKRPVTVTSCYFRSQVVFGFQYGGWLEKRVMLCRPETYVQSGG